MNDETISIIIPVYNVERYLNRCVESVLQETYPHIEVLLIDDGSTDRCGALCDEWAEKDPRIRAVHKENGGISDARNKGLDIAAGEYVVFIDSDDYITADMVKKLYDALKENKADMSICNFLHVDEKGIPIPRLKSVLPIQDEVLSGTEAIIKLHSPTNGHWYGWHYSMAWNKLYKKSLFDDIRFPKGKFCEDVFIAHRLYAICSRVACIRDICYYYTQRANSITSRRSAITYLNDAEGYLDRALFCYDRDLFRTAGHAYWYSAMLLSHACPSYTDTKAMQKEYKETLECFRRNNHCCKPCTVKEKIQILIVYISPKLYRLIFRNPLRITVKKALWKPKE